MFTGKSESYSTCGRVRGVFHANSETELSRVEVNGRTVFTSGTALHAQIYYDGVKEGLNLKP